MNHDAIGVFDSGLGGLTAVKALNQILPIINMLKAKDTEIAVFGFNEWQNYNSISKELFHYDTYFTSPFFIDFKSEETIKFLKKYRDSECI